MEKEKGFSLLEVIIAIALIGIVAVAFLGALATGSKAIFIADERATAESLARSQMEYVKNQDYSVAPWAYTVTSLERSSSPEPSWWGTNPSPLLSSNYAGYSVEVNADPLPDPNNPDNDLVGIQKITVTVNHYYRPDKPEVLTLEDYKVDR
jgi:prepilin-type N-terminal cleavage/methylation domain-containing protein